MQPAELEQRWLRFRARPDPAVREQLILQYAPLVKYVLGRIGTRPNGPLGAEDLISYGTIGLIQAVDRFDPAQGVKFETYAIRRIRGSMIDALRGLQPLSREAARRAREIEQAYDRLTQRLGRMPDEAEVGAELGLSPTELQAGLLEASTVVVSFDSVAADAGDGERAPLVDQLADLGTPGVADQVQRAELYARLTRAIEELPERERLAISLYYYEDLTLKEIAGVLGVSTSRVCQLNTAAILKLRAVLRFGREQAGAVAGGGRA